ncbi:unnamed protein product [Larinioides sclopetarius]|uniref:Uncharacterized protein n=1 Tax=Larinioides sclopetarius TaxID=280406 RepID=A0AAV1YVK9_9ARAC
MLHPDDLQTWPTSAFFSSQRFGFPTRLQDARLANIILSTTRLQKISHNLLCCFFFTQPQRGEQGNDPVPVIRSYAKLQCPHVHKLSLCQKREKDFKTEKSCYDEFFNHVFLVLPCAAAPPGMKRTSKKLALPLRISQSNSLLASRAPEPVG